VGAVPSSGPVGDAIWKHARRVGLSSVPTGLNGKFLRFRRDGVSKPRSFYKAGIEKLATRWETVIASTGNYIIDKIL
jgi:hypothetical protein